MNLCGSPKNKPVSAMAVSGNDLGTELPGTTSRMVNFCCIVLEEYFLHYMKNSNKDNAAQ